jgi:hypothetical protein
MQVTLPLLAGLRPDGQAVIENVPAKKLNDQHWYELESTPAFVKDIARGDVITVNPAKAGDFSLQTRGGNLAIRVLAKTSLASIRDALTGELEKLGGQLDIDSERILVYSIHVSCGFQAIEQILDKYLSGREDCTWYYGNVYDPNDGETPLNWWTEILKPI